MTFVGVDAFGLNEMPLIPTSKWSPKMIVFDKDGTLGDCTPALNLWCHRMTTIVRRRCEVDNISHSHLNNIIAKFHESIGWDADINDVIPSAPLSAATWEEIVVITAECLSDAGLDVALDEVREWHQNLGDIHAEDLPLIKNLPGFLKRFKHHGVKISICTSDDRKSTNACMRNWNISDLIDFSICGDEVFESKPSAQPLMELCHRAGVMPHDCLVIGDTSSDTGMGKNSGAGLVVGVLTGSGTEKQLLETGAHVVLTNIGYLHDLLEKQVQVGTKLEEDIEHAVEESENMIAMKVKAA